MTIATGDEIKIRDARIASYIFGGYIKDIDYKFLNNNTYVQVCKCQDYKKLITDVSSGVTADYSAGTSTEKQILTALFAAYCPDITVGSYVIPGELVAIEFANSSLTRAIDELAAINERKWYVDYNKNLHYFTSGGEVASFNLSDSPDETTTFGYSGLEYTLAEDATERASLTCWHPGLFAGQTIGITNTALSWANKQFLITNISTKIRGRPDDVDYVLEHQVTLGTIQVPRFTNEMVRAGRVVTTARIADMAVTSAKIDDLAITNAKIANLTITDAKIANLAITTAKIDNLAITNAKINDCSIDKLTAGNLTVTGTITTGKFVTGASGTNRIEIDKDYISGYNSSNEKQFYLSASDGKAYCAAGKIVLDKSGIYIEGTSDTLLKFKSASDDTNYQFIASLDDGVLQIGAAKELQICTGFTWISAGEKRIRIGVASTNYLEITESFLGIKTLSIMAAGNITPNSSNAYNLGTSSYYWKQIHGRTICVNAGGGAAEALQGAIFYDVVSSTYWWGCYINGAVRSVQFTY